jgi:hypothetical protein
MDTLVRISGSFTVVAGGAAADPTAVSLFVKPPTGAVVTYTLSGSQVVKDSVGNYHYDLLANLIGNWTYKWQGAGAIQVTSPDASFQVNTTVFAAQL